MAQWIWKFGEFEVYHNELLHNRRLQYGYREPPVWKIYSPDSAVRFRKKVTTQGGELRITASGYFAVTTGTGYHDRVKHGGKSVILLEPGTTEINITVSSSDSFPCLYVDGAVTTDASWEADDLTGNFAAVGTYTQFDAPEKSPAVFPFSKEPLSYVKKEELEHGLLFDFGKETFAATTYENAGDSRLFISFGESREEALDPKWSVIHFDLQPENGTLSIPPQAFRYIYVDRKEVDVRAEYEYLPLERRGSFVTGEDVIDQVWETAAYTFHLNCREFFLDGIKRDRWVWSADAYQSLFVNRYLFLDQDIEKRTLIALGGKKPFQCHINTIMDYSFFWIISLWEYYKTYGDKEFLHQIYPQLQEVMAFCRGRTDPDGFMRGKANDWVFIDWAPMDKTGALCGEQILYAKALEHYADICGVIAQPGEDCRAAAEALRGTVMDRFYDAEKRVFIDSFESGKRNVTRHSNILAYLFLPLSEQQKNDIYERVLLNDDVAQITTPYFKFYENQVHCEQGNTVLLEQSIREYYGSMLETGATTLYEEYDPEKNGAEHYAMYGSPYEKSLCHAWSASPIYLLGCYRAGVRNTGIAYDRFEVRPELGDLTAFDATVPVPGGEVHVTLHAMQLQVHSSVPGGTLYYNGEEHPLPVHATVAMKLS